MTPTTVFRNENFIALDKPYGWLSVPSRSGLAEKRPILGIWLQDQLNSKVFPVHRLDCEVSGLILYALNSAAHRAASGWFENHQVRKNYTGLSAASQDLPPAGLLQTWKSNLARGKRRAYEAEFGKPSVTEAMCEGAIEAGEVKYSQWQLRPLTGRSHQLRFEMARHGYPICGDELYGSDVKWLDGSGIALRSTELSFVKCKDAVSLGLPATIVVSSISSILGSKPLV
jgi:23S rRNA-/tRNA-specific pseudouridylate synthase